MKPELLSIVDPPVRVAMFIAWADWACSKAVPKLDSIMWESQLPIPVVRRRRSTCGWLWQHLRPGFALHASQIAALAASGTGVS